MNVLGIEGIWTLVDSGNYSALLLSPKSTIDDMEMNGHGPVPIKLYL